jgi:CRP-like cAMP-binding protein
VDERRFLFLVQQTPNFAIHLMRVLSDRLRRMDRRIAQQA